MNFQICRATAVRFIPAGPEFSNACAAPPTDRATLLLLAGVQPKRECPHGLGRRRTDWLQGATRPPRAGKRDLPRPDEPFLRALPSGGVGNRALLHGGGHRERRLHGIFYLFED